MRHFARSLLVAVMVSARSAEAAPPVHRQLRAQAPQASQAPAGPAEVLFTFDDGPHLTNTPKVLAELEKRGVKAIFFVNGSHFDHDLRARELLKQELERGHYVGNHTYSHRILCRHLKDAPGEIDHNEDLLEQVLGFRPTLLRTPYGQHCRKLKQVIAERGYHQVGWDIDAQEWRGGKRGDQVAKFIISRLGRLRGRAIVLLHDTHHATVQALPAVLEWLTQHPEVKVLDWRALLDATPPPAPVAGPVQPTSALLQALDWLWGRIAAATHGLPGPRPLAAARNLML